MDNVIELKNVSKKFKTKIIYNNINLEIEKGNCVGFVGGNGSGKSVLFQLITGLIPIDSGKVVVNGVELGKNNRDFPQDVGILINEPGYISYLSGLNNLLLLAEIQNIIDENKVRDTMLRVGLNPDDKTPVKKYSMGMKQKLGIAQAIMEDQSIIILDEPYNALDFNTNIEITKILEGLKSEGKTILLTSHQHDYMRKLCDEMYLIKEYDIVSFDEELQKDYFAYSL